MPYIYISQGRYRDYRTAIRKYKKNKEPNPLYLLHDAQYYLLGKGDINRAAEHLQLFWNTLKKMEVRLYLGNAAFFLAVLYAAQGEIKKARYYLKKYLPLLKKYGNKKYLLLLKIILEKLPPNKDIMKIKTHYLIFLLKKAYLSKKMRDYKRAYQYAKKEYMLGILHRISIFLPETVQALIKKGKPTGLPKAILKLPVFNKETPIYHIKFLGDLVVFRTQKYLKTKLKPKESAFLIYLCQKAMEPKKSVYLEEVYANFWPRSEKASRNFSHLLVKLKKALKIPAHLLEISRGSMGPILINQGIYFTTDYQEFEKTLAQAKALERAGEWGFARKEFLQTFKLFRGEPFKKNFDNWSVDMRFKILNQFETEAINFARSCLEHNNKNDVRKILQKILKIIPDSEEAIELAKRLNYGWS